MLTIKWRLFIGTLFLGCACLHTVRAAPPDDVVEKSRLERMLAEGDTGMIAQVFKRYPGRTLPFIDQYFEGGLAMIEKGEDPAKALELYRKGIRFAEIADKAFGVLVFTDYTNAFASWSPTEQKTFREGQREFKEGAKEKDPVKARQALERSLALAQSLGDLWGQAMAQVALADLMLNAGEYPLALATAIQAVELNSKLQLRRDCAQAFRLAGAAALKTDQPTSSAAYLSQAWTLIERDQDIDAAFREETFTEYLAVLESCGMKDRANQLRQQRAKTSEDGELGKAEPDSQQ